MLSFNLNKKSWHMWVANFGGTRIGQYDQTHGTDICTYTRAFVKGVFWLAVATFTSSLFLTWICVSLYKVVAWAFGYLDVLPDYAAIFLGLVAAFSFVFAAVAGVGKYLDYKEDKRMRDRENGVPPPEPGFTKLAYRKLKDKTCFKINFKKED